MKLNSELISSGGATVVVLGLWALIQDAGSAWMAVAAVAVTAIAAGLALCGPEFRPMATGFAVFAVTHAFCAFDLDAVAVVLSAGLVVVMVSSIITGLRVLRTGHWPNVTRYLPLVSGVWGITIPLALALGGFTAHDLALALYGAVWTALGLAISRIENRQPVLA
jgi:hypothetical protein